MIPCIFKALALGTALVLAPMVSAQGLKLEEAKKTDIDINPADKVEFQGSEAAIGLDGMVTVYLRLITRDNFHPYTDKVTFKGPDGYKIKSLKGPVTKRLLDPIMGKEVEVYESGEFTLEMAGLETWTKPQFPLEITFVACTESICLFPYTQTLLIPAYSTSPSQGAVAAAPTPPVPALATATPALQAADAPGPGSGSDLADIQQDWAAKFKKGSLPLSLVLGLLFLAGLLTNLTPCVFPMIPITMRLLGNQGQHPFTSSTLYAAGIVLSYSGLGLIVGLSGGVFGALAASTTFNVIFAIIMTMFGFSMLGYGDFSKLQNIGARIGSGDASALNTVLMGMGAGLVASPCTGPILAALLASAATSADAGQAAFFLFVYSLGFALPYVFLGSLAASMNKIKVRPIVQVGVKGLFAAVMFALAFYYLRVPFHRALVSVSGHWAMFALATTAAGLVLVAATMISLNSDSKKYRLVFPTLVLGLGLFATSQWATGGDTVKNAALFWYHDEQAGLAAAAQQSKPILIDGWAEWCEACKKMDATTFVDSELGTILARDWILVKLDLTDMNEANQALAEKYGLQGLPTLVLLPPNGDIENAASIAGYVNSPSLIKKLGEFKSALPNLPREK